MTTDIRSISIETLLEMFDPTVRDRIRAQWDRPDVAAVVVFENLAMDSSRLGERSALAVGPGCTYADVDAVRGQRLGDVPSRFQYPVAAAVKADGSPVPARGA